ncbi:TPA: hypothetical protein ACW5QZ_004802, partial [Salmonella enterica]
AGKLPVEPRFIPAGAGNTARRGVMTMLRPVYPRWRGEYNNQVSSNSQQRGLSPLARGIRVR